jgi:hypothetical protein
MQQASSGLNAFLALHHLAAAIIAFRKVPLSKEYYLFMDRFLMSFLVAYVGFNFLIILGILLEKRKMALEVILGGQ